MVFSHRSSSSHPSPFNPQVNQKHYLQIRKTKRVRFFPPIMNTVFRSTLLIAVFAFCSVQAQTTCSGDQWVSGREYCEGSIVVDDGSQYTSKWCNVNQKPSDNNGIYDSWTNNGECLPQCSGQEWDDEQEYCAGASVYQDGKQYKSKWCNINTPPATNSGNFDAWKFVSACKYSKSSSKTQSRRRLASRSSTCTGEQWDASVQYCQGAKVMDEGTQYTSKWCTTGYKPSEHDGEFDAWTKNGKCLPACEGVQWMEKTEYCDDDIVYQDGNQYEAKWCTYDQSPATNCGSFDSWAFQKECGDPLSRTFPFPPRRSSKSKNKRRPA